MENTNGTRSAFAAGAESWNQSGLSKREYFAAMALQGLSQDNSLTAETTAKFAVQLADELLKKLDNK